MDSPGRLLLAAGCWLLLMPPPGGWGLETRALHSFYPQESPPSSEKELLGALQEVLEKLQNKRIPPWGKKPGQVPACEVGELCAVRKASRIGKLCNCPRRATCNFFLLKCL
ncbi:cocaine- and amphetamine-regulated transcript protein-like [Emydura macquarii macquarii]|uniref:cocaine- and amphetamine-regulated transcript protein-like n=1 Tax=Emydura macquarii macquarii TaxID=1129001 RepID=UPI00352B33F0